MKMKYLYLILCIFGIILPYSQLIPYMLENTFDIASFIDQLFVNRVSALIALDLFVTALTYIIFAVSEGISLKIKHLWGDGCIQPHKHTKYNANIQLNHTTIIAIRQWMYNRRVFPPALYLTGMDLPEICK